MSIERTEEDVARFHANMAEIEKNYPWGIAASKIKPSSGYEERRDIIREAMKDYAETTLEQLAVVRGEREALRQQLRLANEDWAEDDTKIRELCRPILGDAAVDGDSYSVPSVVDLVEQLIAERAALLAKPCPHIVSSPDGTSYCTLAESSAGDMSRAIEDWRRSAEKLIADNQALRAERDKLQQQIYTNNAAWEEQYEAKCDQRDALRAENKELHLTLTARNNDLDALAASVVRLREALDKLRQIQGQVIPVVNDEMVPVSVVLNIVEPALAATSPPAAHPQAAPKEP
jgi:regulator of replication initiation timing